MTWTKSVGVVGLLAVASASFAIVDSFVLNHNGATYSEGNLRLPGTNSNNGLANFSTSNGIDNLAQNWWWFRFTGDGREFALSNQVFSQQDSPSTIRLVYRERDVIFDLQYTLTALNPNHARVQIGFKIENLRNTPVGVDFFSYTDYDLNNTAGDDTGQFVGPNYMTVTDGASPTWGTLTASAGSLIGWEMRDYPNLVGRLSNNQITNLNNGADAGPNDWTGAFQWRVDLTPPSTGGFGNQFVGSLVKEIYNPVPEPASLLALAGGLGLLVARRRRK
ncbi:MAG TPA: PEP-CTERM sorting domain-containing protein [Fimbriimonadaceae bacterium]|nr:PEP-CTERM sorting domain-containing protein [Fimbriimonadaceae bacterium]